MAGKGRHPILGVWSPDPVLSLVAPIGLGAAAGTALVVDLCVNTGARGRSLAGLVADGPKLAELSPGRSGIAWLPGGPVDRTAAIETIAQLASHWPALVVRLPDQDSPFATVPVMALYPGRLAPAVPASNGVWQPVRGGADPPGPGPVLPRLRSGAVRRMLAGQLPHRGRWVSAWNQVWEMPWA